MDAVKWSCKMRWKTEFSADSVEWCPLEPFTDVLVCGTYQLFEEDEDKSAATQKRLGKLHLFIVTDDTMVLKPVQTIDTAGILDQKWCYNTLNDRPTLAVATSEGCIQLYQLHDDLNLELKFWMEESIGNNILALSLDWSTNKSSCVNPLLVVSDSSGIVTVFKINESGMEKIGCWKSHGFEAWIGSFNYWDSNVFYSGGDDCLFKSYDVRIPEAVSSNRSHEAGVTAIRSHLGVEHQLLTGSYDEKFRLWDTRSLRRSVTEVDAKGGVWRFKWHPKLKDVILAACMYGGFRTAKLTEGELNITSEYLEHESIAYGADWKFINSKSIVATCSFYDKKLHISEIV